MTTVPPYYPEALALLQRLISIPSFSREEGGTADVLVDFFVQHGLSPVRVGHNVVVYAKNTDPAKPTILLNSHHDTVKPNGGYTRDPFAPTIEGDRLYGLGANDAGSPLVSLIAAFLQCQGLPLSFNLLLVASAEEEVSGEGGIASVLPHLSVPIVGAIVGEPTGMRMAVAERGLVVIDAVATGRAGHAARGEGENALYTALDDIAWIRQHQFEKISPLLGTVKTTVTVMDTRNRAHNVVPDECRFVIDARVNELYTLDEVVSTLQAGVKSTLSPRSLRLGSTMIAHAHPLVQAGLSLGLESYGSPTLSDKSLMPFPALKLGPGESARSHSADEYICLSELKAGIATYIELLSKTRMG